MTTEEIVAKLQSEPELAAKYASLTSIDAIQAQADKDGFDVSKDQISEVLARMQGQSGELSESELASVAGGKGGTGHGTYIF